MQGFIELTKLDDNLPISINVERIEMLTIQEKTEKTCIFLIGALPDDYIVVKEPYLDVHKRLANIIGAYIGYRS